MANQVEHASDVRPWDSSVALTQVGRQSLDRSYDRQHAALHGVERDLGYVGIPWIAPRGHPALSIVESR